MPGITRTDRTVHNIKLGASRIPLPRKIFVRDVAPTIHLAGSTYECQGRRKASSFARSLLSLLRLHRETQQRAAREEWITLRLLESPTLRFCDHAWWTAQ